nr:zinc finger, CCHC-type [Tanacetum cinerariifolium]
MVKVGRVMSTNYYLEAKGGDGGACKVLRWLLEVLIKLEGGDKRCSKASWRAMVKVGRVMSTNYYLEAKGGDGGACKVLRWLLEVLIKLEGGDKVCSALVTRLLAIERLSRIDQERFIVVVFLEGAEGFSVWASRFDDILPLTYNPSPSPPFALDLSLIFFEFSVAITSYTSQSFSSIEQALEVLLEDMEAQVKTELNKKAHSAVILCLGNKVLREVTGEMTAAESRGKSRSKYRGGRLKCYIFQSEDHLKRNYSKNNRKNSTGYVKKDEQPSSSGLTYDDSEVMSAQAQALLDWIIDSGCSYHMTPRECKIRGIGKVRIQLKDGSSFVLNNVRYIPELKRNLISLGTLEKKGYTKKLQSGKVEVINGSRVILSGIRRDNCVYFLDGHALAGELNVSVEEKDSLVQ